MKFYLFYLKAEGNVIHYIPLHLFKTMQKNFPSILLHRLFSSFRNRSRRNNILHSSLLFLSSNSLLCLCHETRYLSELTIVRDQSD